MSTLKSSQTQLLKVFNKYLLHNKMSTGFVQKIVCGFPNFSRKKIRIFKTFQGDFYLYIYQ